MRFLLRAITQGYIQKLIALLIIDALLFTNTNATNVSSITLVIGFVLLVMTTYYLTKGFLVLVAFYGIRAKRPNYLALSISTIIGGLLALQSVGELGLHDVIVVVLLGTLAYFYSSYNSSTKRSSGDS
jgi:uncharacterized membrane protein YdbT with pleckstrin-like domain